MFSGVQSVLWTGNVCDNRVAAVVRTSVALRTQVSLTSVVDAGIDAVPGAARALPILWMTETSWLPNIRQSKLRNQGNRRRLTRHGTPSRREEARA